MDKRKAIIKHALFYPGYNSSLPSMLKLLFNWEESKNNPKPDDQVNIRGTSEEICKKVRLEFNGRDCDFKQLINRNCVISKRLKNEFFEIEMQETA